MYISCVVQVVHLDVMAYVGISLLGNEMILFVE